MQDAVRAKSTATVKKICMVAFGFFADRLIHSNCIVIDLREKKIEKSKCRCNSGSSGTFTHFLAAHSHWCARF